MVNQRDIVPHLPPRILNFYHVPTEVWFHPTDLKFRVCDGSGEDPKCSSPLDGDEVGAVAIECSDGIVGETLTRN